MSKVLKLIRESKNAMQEQVASTIRLPKELNTDAEGLAEYLGISKQQLFLNFIEDGMEAADRELNREEEVRKGKFGCHVLNTNKRHSLDDHEWMLSEGVAAAFYAPWKFNIDRIKKGDTVFLYENGVGIVAWGKGTGEVLVSDHNGDAEECRYQKLEGFQVLSKPLPAAEIKKILDRNVVFLRTMSGMPDGEKLMKRIIFMPPQ